MGFRAAIAAFYRFNADDGWAIASHIALSALMALFPFLIVLGSLARLLGANEIADDVVGLMFETWPEEVADRIGSEIHAVLTTKRSDLLTISLVLSVYFASSGVESLRIGLNRAYGMVERRNWLVLRLESIIYVLVTLAALLALGFLIVLGRSFSRPRSNTRPGSRRLKRELRSHATPLQRWSWWSHWFWCMRGCRPAAAPCSKSCPA
jgi:membrane protein